MSGGLPGPDGCRHLAEEIAEGLGIGRRDVEFHAVRVGKILADLAEEEAGLLEVLLALDDGQLAGAADRKFRLLGLLSEAGEHPAGEHAGPSGRRRRQQAPARNPVRHSSSSLCCSHRAVVAPALQPNRAWKRKSATLTIQSSRGHRSRAGAARKCSASPALRATCGSRRQGFPAANEEFRRMREATSTACRSSSWGSSPDRRPHIGPARL